MRTNVIKEVHDGSSAGQGNLANGHSTRGEELSGFALQGVQGEESEELVHEALGLGVQGGGELGRRDGLVEVLDDEVLRVGSGQAPEVDQQTVPGALLGVTVLEGLEGQVSSAPGKGIDNVLVFFEHIE